MAKFKVRLKLEGLELEIDGSREDVPVIAEALQKQVGTLVNPTGALIEDSKEPEPLPKPESQDQTPKKKTRRRRKPRATANLQPDDAVQPIDFKHDPSVWGSPLQSWSTANKSVWLIYVVDKQAKVNELSFKQIELTFNKHFRQSGEIKGSNINRDLGKLKTKQGSAPAVGENTTVDPSTWYLTDAGVKVAEELVKEARGPSSAT